LLNLRGVALACRFDRKEIVEDDDLASLRGDPEFEAVVEEVVRRAGGPASIK